MGSGSRACALGRNDGVMFYCAAASLAEPPGIPLPRGCGGAPRRLERGLRPIRQLLRLVVQTVPYAAIWFQRARSPLGVEGEGPAALPLEPSRGVLVGLEINEVVDDEAEHHAVGIDAGAADNSSHVDAAESGKKFGNVIGVHGSD